MAALPEEGRIATATTSAVPLGLYARSALESLGLWPALQSALIEVDSAAAAARLVALSEAPFGLLYATDAQALGLPVRSEIPLEATGPISYPLAAVTRQGAPFVEWVLSPAGRAPFLEAGFTDG